MGLLWASYLKSFNDPFTQGRCDELNRVNRMQTPPAPEAKTKPWGEVAIVILLNIVPLIGVTFWGWSVFALVFLYWIENLVIGLLLRSGWGGLIRRR